MSNAQFVVPEPYNEPVCGYGPGTPEREALKATLVELQSKEIEVPLIIGGKEVRTGNTAEMREPHNHSRKLGGHYQRGIQRRLEYRSLGHNGHLRGRHRGRVS